MASESVKKNHPVSPHTADVKRRGLLRFGTLLTAFTGASAISAIGANIAHAGPGDKTPPTSYVPLSEKGAPTGVATLDAASKILPAQLPDLSAAFAPTSGSTVYAPMVSPALTGNPLVGGVPISTVHGGVSVLSYGAQADMRSPSDVTMNSGSATITSSSFGFTVGDVGKYVRLAGAGVAGAALVTTIASVTNGTTAVLAASASTTVSGATAFVGTDNTAAFQNAVNALPTGGQVTIPQGRYLLSGTVNVTVPIRFQGSVASYNNPSHGTYLGEVSPGVSGFLCSADNVRFYNIALNNTATYADVSAAAAAIGINFTSGTGCRVEDCRIYGWYTALWFQNCALWSVEKNSISASVKYHIRIQNVATPDAGDQFLERNYFTSTPPYAPEATIRYESGGGLKMIGNKILGGTYGVDLAVADGVSTSIIVITGNSFETVTNGHLRFGQLGTTGKYRQCVISGNQFSGQNIGSNYYMQFNAGISEVNISGNMMYGPNGAARYINILGGSRYNIDGNSFNDGLVGININTGGLDVRVGDGNKFRGIIDPVIDGGVFSMNSRETIIHEYSRTIPGIGTGSYTALVQIGFGTPGAAEVEFAIYGRLTTAGVIAGVGVRVHRLLVQTVAGAAPLVTVIGTDTQVGQLNLQFDTTTTVGSLRIGVKRDPSDGADSFSGMYRVKVSGAQNRVSLLTNA